MKKAERFMTVRDSFGAVVKKLQLVGGCCALRSIFSFSRQLDRLCFFGMMAAFAAAAALYHTGETVAGGASHGQPGTVFSFFSSRCHLNRSADFG
jgi:hypothetical protein